VQAANAKLAPGKYGLEVVAGEFVGTRFDRPNLLRPAPQRSVPGRLGGVIIDCESPRIVDAYSEAEPSSEFG
jgi:hypothetical protein